MKEQYTDSFIETLYNTHKAEWEATPSNRQAVEWLCELIEFLFPNNRLNKHSTYEGRLKKNQIDLENILLSYLDPQDTDIGLAVNSFYASLEDIYQNLRFDATKIYEHDPAATSIHEVIVSYPGFYAIAVYRIANRLSQSAVPILPRILSEYAHGKTGVDIHPNATIGVPFCIDHGTGIVIGATSIIGKDVIIYQGVTLGASQVSKGLSDVKRHPTVQDNVIIYARSTILGGRTVIGHNSVIGGSVFLTKSVSPYSNVFNTHQLRIEIKENTSV
ncbi:serine O-acetyltransferase [Mucilaginibacter sp. SP1R1]|uniref:serine O-acetyltransferase n=1 Tax=Mucilaginibacter sp. SP1R1 TaxID=2723091 RepID=UPI00160714E8|nr:serine O-acetyltransferase [Mucilaginibacter sp. SP1R1]MBB6149000.1 serine O-acetyltransferase [Mucilaginibacter sp. SP1R1]